MPGLPVQRTLNAAAACPLMHSGRRAVQAKGAGYAISQDAELALVADVALATGIILDPV